MGDGPSEAGRQLAGRQIIQPWADRPEARPPGHPARRPGSQRACLPANQPASHPPRIHQRNSGPLPSASFLSHIIHTLRRKPSEVDWSADMPGVPRATGEGAGRRQPASQARRRHAVTTMRPRNACSAEPARQLASHAASQRGSQAAIQGPSKPSNLTASQLPDEAAKRQHRKPAIRTPPLSPPSEKRLPLSSLSLSLCLLFRQRRKPETQARMELQRGAEQFDMQWARKPTHQPKAIKATPVSLYPPHHLAPFCSVGNVGEGAAYTEGGPASERGERQAHGQPAQHASNHTKPKRGSLDEHAVSSQPTDKPAIRPAIQLGASPSSHTRKPATS
jgi:hypothetical protein